ncbi:hypothetical protein Tco_0689947, partial [Tanacetum coccineum]
MRYHFHDTDTIVKDLEYQGSQISAQRNSSELGHGLLSCWISSYHHHGLEYPGSNGSDREDNMGYCFNAKFAGPER